MPDHPPHLPPATHAGADAGWRLRLYTVIFEADTRAGRLFDLVLVAMILGSVAVVVLDSMAAVHARHAGVLAALEWAFTALFTVEYLARLACVRHPLRYARSPLGVIDLLAVLPTYLAVAVPGLHVLIDVRVLRLLRLFRILKLGAYVAEFGMLGRALAASRRKILVFMAFVMMVVMIMGTLMYVVEGPEHGYTSIPVGVYWAITTMTTVGFGDITPHTDLGRVIASAMMLLGWGTLAVPTGIVSAEFTVQRMGRTPTTRTCHECLSEGHAPSARFCRDCGAPLPPWQRDAGPGDATPGP
ncbi:MULTISPECIES: ion transporter [Roseateles]|uniref:Ion transporter n=1 Tax=Pelomonas caseinilytica TaxID=2906763 RepID=A0ABS8XGQ2_9BURK|nr:MULTISPECIES: ion transporter [unclassified Roseateles]MCE4540062.1 ion transporter [Pelomonas sp. P7]HEV6964333.1 ion transporter [Roseateles sp.]